MEIWQRDLVTKNLDKLVFNTICSTDFLNKFLASKILSEEDVEELSIVGDTPSTKATKFYKIILKREHGFQTLLEVLKETKQSGARSILKTAITLWRHNHLDVNSVDYDKNKVLGEGSNGTMVFKGTFGGRAVAVKRVNSDNDQKKTIIKEIENLKYCDAQENIVRYYGAAVMENFVLILLELCDMTLKEWLPTKSIKILPLNILQQVTTGLGYLHSKRLVHRDLKPENILLTSELNRVKISDFGLSRKIADEKQYVSSFGGGTQGWIAPEILQKFDDEEEISKYQFTFESDVFSLGCVYFYVFSDGKHPFGSRAYRTANILQGKYTIDAGCILQGNSEATELLKLMICNDPDSRPSCLALLSSPFFQINEKKQKKTIRGGKIIITHEPKPSGDQKQHKAVRGRKSIGTATKEYFEVRDRCKKIKQIAVIKPIQRPPLCELEANILVGLKSISTSTDSNHSNTSTHFSSLDMTIDSRSESTSLTLVNPSTKHIPPPPPPMKNRNHCVINMDHTFENSISTQPINSQWYGSSDLLDATRDWNRIALSMQIKRLFHIVESENLSIIKKVLQNKYDVDLTEVECDRHISLLHAAVKCRDFPVVEYLLHEHQFSKVLATAKFRNIISNGAVLRNICESFEHEFETKYKIIPLLLQICPGLIHYTDESKNRRTVLHHAIFSVFDGYASNQQLKVIRMLLKNNANVYARDAYGETPLFYVARYRGCSSNFLDLIKLLVENYADPIDRCKNGETFLHLACSKVSQDNFHALVKYFISIGKNYVFTNTNTKGQTVLHYFVKEKHMQPETLELLVLHGANVSAVDNDGTTVVSSAIMYGRTELFLKRLVQLGACWWTTDSHQNSLLHVAAYKQNLPVLKLLISLGCDVNAQNDAGDTPLLNVFYAASVIEAKGVDVVHELINHGANINIRNKSGKRAISFLLLANIFNLYEKDVYTRICKLLATSKQIQVL